MDGRIQGIHREVGMVEGRLCEVQGHAEEYLRRCWKDWTLRTAFMVEVDEGFLVLFIEGETHLGVVG